MKRIQFLILIGVLSSYLHSCGLIPKESPQGHCVGVLKNELKEGLWTCTDGQSNRVQMKAFFTAGKKDGRVELFYPSGETQSISFWKRGMLDGLFKSYFRNGLREFEMYYHNGVRSESFYEWNIDGDLVED